MNKDWGWVWPLPGNVPWEIERLTREGRPSVNLRARVGSRRVHAVEAGTVVKAHLGTLIIQGDSGFVRYLDLIGIVPVVQGEDVQQGQYIGEVYLSLGYDSLKMDIWPELPDEGTPENTIDPYPHLLSAWCRVTDRFHRDLPPPPTDSAETRELVRWLHEHPLWHYPISIPVPPPGVSEDFVETEDGNFRMPDTSGWPKKMERYGGGMHECLCYDFVYVEPTTEMCRGATGREEQDPRNTVFRVWIEGGGWMDQSKDPDIPEPPRGWTEHNKWISCHDDRLNCGAPSMEEALVQLAMKVKFFYEDNGDDREVPTECGGDFENFGEENERYVDYCEDAGDGFCKKCGYLIDAPEIDDEEDETA